MEWYKSTTMFLKEGVSESDHDQRHEYIEEYENQYPEYVNWTNDSYEDGYMLMWTTECTTEYDVFQKLVPCIEDGKVISYMPIDTILDGWDAVYQDQ